MEKTYKEIAREREDEEQEQYLTEWRKTNVQEQRRILRSDSRQSHPGCKPDSTPCKGSAQSIKGYSKPVRIRDLSIKGQEDREGIPMETVKEENEKKKEYLKQYGKALRQEKRIEEELERLKLDRMLPGALAADGLPKSSNLSDLSDYMAEVDEQERKLVEQRKKRVRIRTEIRERIEQMEDETEKDVLTYCYIDLMRWKDICRKTGYEWAQVHRKHSEALKNFKMI